MPDIEGMKQVSLACCPSNAVRPVKDFVAARGRRGYVSPFRFADAEIDILNYINLDTPSTPAMCGPLFWPGQEYLESLDSEYPAVAGTREYPT